MNGRAQTIRSSNVREQTAPAWQIHGFSVSLRVVAKIPLHTRAVATIQAEQQHPIVQMLRQLALDHFLRIRFKPTRTTGCPGFIYLGD
jgi:hypothetical protein